MPNTKKWRTNWRGAKSSKLQVSLSDRPACIKKTRVSYPSNIKPAGKAFNTKRASKNNSISNSKGSKIKSKMGLIVQWTIASGLRSRHGSQWSRHLRFTSRIEGRSIRANLRSRHKFSWRLTKSLSHSTSNVMRLTEVKLVAWWKNLRRFRTKRSSSTKNLKSSKKKTGG